LIHISRISWSCWRPLRPPSRRCDPFAVRNDNHANRALADLRGKLVRRLAHRGSTLSGVGASGKPGAVHLL